jgi:hypothetical protein
MRAEHFHETALKVRVPRGNEGFWQIICQLSEAQGTFTVADIDGESNASIKNISLYLKSLVAAGYVAKVDGRQHRIKGKYPTPHYRLLRHVARAPRVRADGSAIPPAAQDNLWTAMRSLPSFGLDELVFAATTPEVKPKKSTARRFVGFLLKAGYLNSQPAPHGLRHRGRVFRLKPGMNTGPSTPCKREICAGMAWDPNLKKFVGEAPITSEVLP